VISGVRGDKQTHIQQNYLTNLIAVLSKYGKQTKIGKSELISAS
jgi:hypothetical protein